MVPKISLDIFKNEMTKRGYVFNEHNIHATVDGIVKLEKDHILCYNQVVYDDFKHTIKLEYPDVTDDLLKILASYDRDFKYHLSYQFYKDYMNLENPLYNGAFKTDILYYYIHIGGPDEIRHQTLD